MAYFYLDIIAIGVVVIASIIGMCRGFFASLLSLFGFVATFVCAYFFSDLVLKFLNHTLNFTGFVQGIIGPTIGRVVAVILAFVISYVVLRLLLFILKHTIGKIFEGRTFGKVNSFMGFVLGLGKGGLYVLLALVALNFASLVPQVKTWTSTTFSQTYMVGKVYDWVGTQLGNYLSTGMSDNVQSE